MPIQLNLIKPFLLFSKIFFLFPHKEYWEISDTWKYFSLIAYPIFVYIELIAIKALMDLKIFHTYANALIAFSSSIDILIIGIHITTFVFKKELVNNFLVCICYLYKNNAKRFSININFWTLAAFVIFLIDLCSYSKLFFQNLNYWFCLVITLIYLVVYIILMQFVYFLDFLRETFQILTDSIGDTESALLENVEEHWHLIELCQEVNQLYSKQLLLGMLRVFVTLTLDALYVFDTISKLSYLPEITSIVTPSATNFTWSFVMLLATAHTCELTKETVRVPCYLSI